MEINPNISILTNWILPASLFLIMLGMGLSLTISDFRRVLVYPKAVCIGMVNQLILLPLIAFSLTYIFALPTAFAVGLMLLGFCPGGPSSNLITHVARGDTALAITLTAIASFLTAITIPLMSQWALNHFTDSGDPIHLPFLMTLGQILIITIVPVSIGMWIRHRYTALALRFDKAVRIGATLTFVLILITLIIMAWDIIVAHFVELAGICFLLNASTLLLGFVASKLFALPRPQAISIAVESGIQNTSLAFVMALSILDNYEYGVPAAIYGLLMFVSGGLIMFIFGRRSEGLKIDA